MELIDVYESIKGSRMLSSGELWIPNYQEADYEGLWELIITQIVAPQLGGRDYYRWLERLAMSHYRFRTRKLKDQAVDRYDPLIGMRSDAWNTRQQLSILKFHLYRRAYSLFSTKQENGV